jgi:hypothetical protein
MTQKTDGLFPPFIWAWQNYGKFWSFFRQNDMKPRQNAIKYIRADILPKGRREEDIKRIIYGAGCCLYKNAEAVELIFSSLKKSGALRIKE